jgi:hypothetical protein|tara:strand:- start:904 stop:1113 length:210 start_codon:yes stop_codon:yes gene_type:complete
MSNYDNWLQKRYTQRASLEAEAEKIEERLADGTVRELFDALNVANTDRLIEIISQTADDIVENDMEVGF